MVAILLHSSKSMRSTSTPSQKSYQAPLFLDDAVTLDTYLKTLSPETLSKCMKLSAAKAEETHTLIKHWTTEPDKQLAAIDAFIGDIYSGLQVHRFSPSDRRYANEHLFLLSGLYGILRALDSIYPYRLEMGYRLPDEPFRNLYNFWGSRLAPVLHHHQLIINLSAVEYTKALLPFVSVPVISPKFLTRHKESNEPTFVAVHAKVARGAFAHWMIRHQIEDVARLREFSDLGYSFSTTLSTEAEPTFICSTFDGLGMSVRLS